MSLTEDLIARVQAFIDDDPDPDTREELSKLLAGKDEAGLLARFAAPLTFGTAGLRGEIGAGPARMNRAVVARATAGLCLHLLSVQPSARERGVCIGYDGRRMSRELAEETAAVCAGFGVRVHLFAAPVPTPLLAFGVLDVKAAAGVMVTASHNPAADNGYKAYWENGAQIIPPHDIAIEKAMSAVTSVAKLARIGERERVAQGLQRAVGEGTERRYLDGVARVARLGSEKSRELGLAYTALHGVGHKWVRAALAEAGFTRVHSVAEQAEPHPDFPTVKFPNPEEHGAMDRVLALAEREQAALVLANDPDADRLAIAARGKDGKLVPFTGNELGFVLADALLARYAQSGKRKGLVLSSIVSSPLVGVIAAGYGARWEPTLTGFKWIANRAMVLEREGFDMVLGLEEALGYSPGALVRDKDGVSSALCVASIAAELHAEGRTLLDALDAIFEKHGAYTSGQVSLKAAGLDGPSRMAAVMQRARQSPPKELSGLPVSAVIDLRDGAFSGTPSFDPRILPSSDVVMWELGEHGRIALRPSGTEPKLKLYLDTASRVQGGDVRAARARATALLEQLSSIVRERLGL